VTVEQNGVGRGVGGAFEANGHVGDVAVAEGKVAEEVEREAAGRPLHVHIHQRLVASRDRLQAGEEEVDREDFCRSAATGSGAKGAVKGDERELISRSLNI